MLAKANLPESVPQASPEIRVSLNGFTLSQVGVEKYFLAIEAQVDLALSRQNGARQ